MSLTAVFADQIYAYESRVRKTRWFFFPTMFQDTIRNRAVVAVEAPFQRPTMGVGVAPGKGGAAEHRGWLIG